MLRHCAESEYAKAWMSRALRPLWPGPEAKLWPSPGYLELCATAHRHAGLLDHFLASTLLHDGGTTLRAHCERDEGARASLLDLLDDWGLPRAEGDDVIVTSRTYSVYEKDMPGFDGEE